MRLCIELECHRKTTKMMSGLDPYTVELRKRFFWCIYCFDWLVKRSSVASFF